MNVNYLAILVCAVAAMVIGTLWYGPLFGKKWVKLAGREMAQGNVAVMMGMTFVAVLVEAYVLSVVLNYAGVTTVSSGLMVAFWAWLGFLAAPTFTNALFGGKKMELFLLESTNHLVSLLVMAVILVSWSGANIGY